MKRLLILILLIAGFFLLAIDALASGSNFTGTHIQKGSDPEVVEIKGEVKHVLEEVCKHGTGRKEKGMHLIVTAEDGNDYNVHIGPSDEVSQHVENLVGETLELKVFKTKKLSEGHYIAKEFTRDGEIIELRDDNLKPYWAEFKNQRKGKGGS